jgi:glycosyltransferase involved in cell wall biosynthesis
MKLSIITINLNNSSGLKKTMESVFNQDFCDYEYIIIDGGSTDNSLEVINEFVNKNQKFSNNDKIKVQFVSEKDNGIYHAMNKGILKAKGDYCYFINSGDYLASEKVITKIMTIDTTEDIVFGNLLICLEGNVIEVAKGKHDLTFLDLYQSVIKHQSTFIKRTLFGKFGLYNESLKIVADWGFFIKAVGLGNASYKYIDTDVAYFDNNGISNNSHELRIRERNLVIKENIPNLMINDYVNLDKLIKYNAATNYKLSEIALKLIAKSVKVFNKLTN